MDLKYKNITVSGKIAVGTTTLSKSLQEILGWEYINTGALQREYDRIHKQNENEHGATMRTDEREQAMEAQEKKMLEEREHIIFEAWLSGFVAKDMSYVLKVLLICSSDDIRIDRVMNRENVDLQTAKNYLKQREGENIEKWKKLYGDFDFWAPEYYDVVIDTYSSGRMETVGRVLDKLGYKQ
ncbi:hypothetical protein A3D06_01440 [Candidatus Roizmanbacteria bacterium RIFCSPHIGHO2_02_FULL_40_9]|uniref:Cytidylate kinase n=2 Tax=Candidatus Roizmaniibacteriota TaxID=1752723 RepID=A0A1F7IMC0_9BACT|nr:MAG: hypothetical protein A3D06_01440 [Candidatus Roizmanbacteria bacterium RIFCSPHIGHO2_02_FULL_40_9]OGK44516.1 MAG: hypothetical protein A2957_00580 [Candidatus Roizmanbacteria bacterium RIFCSPLOWO2_01_FULL_38_11]